MSHSLTEASVGERFATFYKGKLLFTDADEWYEWEGYRWKRVQHFSEVRAAMAQFIDKVALKLEDKITQRDRSSWLTARRAESCLRMAQSHLLQRLGDFDANPHILCTPDGVIDLQTGVVNRTPDRTQLISHQTAVSYDGNYQRKLWDEYLASSIGDNDVIGYLQLVAGYACTGLRDQQSLHLLHGGSGGGKGTFVDTMMYILGDYARMVSGATLLDSGKGNAGSEPREDLMRLQGARMVGLSEVANARMEWNAGTVKSLTGGDLIVARGIHGKRSVEFRFTGKIFYALNDLPKFAAGDDAMWDRMRVIEFPHNFRRRTDRVFSMSERLIAECGPGILDWLVEGARMYYDGNKRIEVPASMARNIERYKVQLAAKPSTHLFIEQHMSRTGDASDVAKLSEINGYYKEFCLKLGVKPESQSELSNAIKEVLGDTRYKSNGRTCYREVKVIAS